MAKQRSITCSPADFDSKLDLMNISGWRCVGLTYIENNKVLSVWEK